MPEEAGPPGAPQSPGSPGRPAPPSGKRPAIGLHIKLPCATLDDVRARYGDDLRQARFFIRTRQPRAIATLVRMEAQLQGGEPCFRAAGVVIRVQDPVAAEEPTPADGEPGMTLDLLAADEAGRNLIVSLGGKTLPALRSEQVPRAASKDVAARPASPMAAAPAAASRPAPPQAPPPVMAPGAAPAVAPAVVPAAPPVAQKASLANGSGKGAIIGIDLGTTNSCAAVVQRGKPLVLPSREGYNTIPSIVALNEKGKLIIGHPAKGQVLTNPYNTVFGAKRLIGRAFSSPVVQELITRFPYKIVPGINGEAAVQLGDQQFSLQKISSLVLAEVKELAQQYLKQPVTRAVITVPAYYNDNQRQAVRQAGQMAGLLVERIVNEPTAAALAFGHGRELHQRVLVYDLGGGTFDASVLELRGNVFEVVSTGGDTFLGGVDFDNVIVDHLLACFKEKNGIAFPGDRVALQRISDAAERAKIALSEQTEVIVRVPFVAMMGDRAYDLEQKLSRPELVKLTGHLIDRSLKVCVEILAARGLEAKDIDEVLLVGGQSRMPLVRERIQQFFGKEPSRAVHPDEAVALGASLLAQSLDSQELEGLVLVDVLPMSIGVGLPGGRFRKVVDRNTSLPHRKQLSISTSRDDQSTLEIAVFQGEHERAQENEYLGTLVVNGVPRGARGAVTFDIEFALSAECLLTVTAVEKKSGRAASATFTTQDTPEAVRKKLEAGREPDLEQDAGGLLGWVKRLFSGRPDARA